MEGFMISIIGTMGFSVFLLMSFSIYYLYLRGAVKDKDRGDKREGKNKRILK